MTTQPTDTTPQPPRSRGLSRRAIVLAAVVLIAIGGLVGTGAIRHPAGPASGTSFSSHPPANASRFDCLRVATFNIHSGVGADGKMNLARIAKVLKSQPYHVIGLNELRGSAPWRSHDQAMQLAERINHLPYLYAPTERRWWHDSFGNGLTASLKPIQWKRVPLDGSLGEGSRNAVVASFDLRGKTLNVIVTHLDRTTDRAAQLKAVTALFLPLPEPAILMGDLNTQPDDPLIQPLRTAPGVVDALEEGCSHKGQKHVDWIFARGLTVARAGLVDNTASDHPLAWAQFDLPPGIHPATRPATRPATTRAGK